MPEVFGTIAIIGTSKNPDNERRICEATTQLQKYTKGQLPNRTLHKNHNFYAHEFVPMCPPLTSYTATQVSLRFDQSRQHSARHQLRYSGSQKNCGLRITRGNSHNLLESEMINHSPKQFDLLSKTPTNQARLSAFANHNDCVRSPNPTP
ncbi:hypothetical protein KIN20_012813 [Parelaphostrongylus tenuis]|uniref:Uncharacterized protein n=1 Tax=Parelaphostrongylus tenuis TaxID=148309 RepID=A0AAD5MV71_PARTN|nr:hypothetical protein KIN20_012813 [Parelaphostrongylus tenuis]